MDFSGRTRYYEGVQVGFVESIQPVQFLPAVTSVPLDTSVGPYGLLTIQNPGSITFTPPRAVSNER